MKKYLQSLIYLRYSFGPRFATSGGGTVPAFTDYNPSLSLIYRRREELLEEETEIMSAEERSFFSKHFHLDSIKTVIFSVSNPLMVSSLNAGVQDIINLKRINDLKDPNGFFREINHKLPVHGLFGCCVSPKCIRKENIFRKLPPLVSHVFYFFHFICNRLCAKMPVTSRIYLMLTGGCIRVMSKTETLGRLYAHGFEIVSEQRINEKYYFIVRKIKKPLINDVPTYGIIFKMLRKGKNGKLIYVYKMRTMDAYSEYLQQYVYVQNNLDKGGKFKDDFRISTIGRFLRKYWIDELPMLFNLLKGEIKLIGVRPLSAHYLSLYSRALREKRCSHKPGLLPPFYADMPETIDKIMASEMRYLHEYERNPFLTDMKYFFRIMHTILVKRARSK